MNGSKPGFVHKPRGGGDGGFSGGGFGGGSIKQVFQTQAGLGHSAAVTALTIEGDCLYSAGKDGQVKVWSWDGNQLQQMSSVPLDGECHSLLMYSGWLFAGMMNGVKAINSTSGTQWPMEHPGGAVAALCAHGTYVFTGGLNGTIRVWEPEATGASFKGLTELTGHTAAIRSLSICTVSTGTSYLVSASADGSVKIWDIAAGGTCLQTRTDHGNWVMSAIEAEAHNEKHLVTAGLDRTIKIYGFQPADGFVPKHEQPCSGNVTSLCITKNAQGQDILACGQTDGKVVLYSFPEFKEVDALAGHPVVEDVLQVAHVPSQLIISGGVDGVLRVFTWT